MLGREPAIAVCRAALVVLGRRRIAGVGRSPLRRKGIAQRSATKHGWALDALAPDPAPDTSGETGDADEGVWSMDALAPEEAPPPGTDSGSGSRVSALRLRGMLRPASASPGAR